MSIGVVSIGVVLIGVVLIGVVLIGAGGGSSGEVSEQKTVSESA